MRSVDLCQEITEQKDKDKRGGGSAADKLGAGTLSVISVNSARVSGFGYIPMPMVQSLHSSSHAENSYVWAEQAGHVRGIHDTYLRLQDAMGRY